jgi:hypothetical protein
MLPNEDLLRFLVLVATFALSPFLLYTVPLIELAAPKIIMHTNAISMISPNTPWVPVAVMSACIPISHPIPM